MELTTLEPGTSHALSKGAAESIVVLRSKDFPEEAPTGSDLFVFSGATSDALGWLDTGFSKATTACDWNAQMFYKSQSLALA